MIPNDHIITNTHKHTYEEGDNSNNGAYGGNRDNVVAITSSNARNNNNSTLQDHVSADEIALTPSPITQVFLSQLSPGTLYVVRVKVKTVGGWSSYSKPSLPFRTPSAS